MTLSAPLPVRLVPSTSGLLLAAALLLLACPARAADIVKANNTDAMSLASSWVNGIAPGINDTAVFDSTLTASVTSFGTGGVFSVLGARVTTGSTLVTIDNITVANYFGLFGGGIDMSAADRDLRVTSLQQQADHTWNVAAGRTLTIGDSSGTAGVGRFAQANNSVLSLVGGGTISISNATAAISLGDTSAFTGSLNTNGTTLAVVAETAESITFGGSLSGTTTISKSGAGTYELPGASTLGGSVTVSAGTLVLSGTNTFSGSALTKAGSGTLLLTGTNTYSGTTTISAGTLEVGDGGTAGSIGSGGITLSSGATLLFDRSDAVSIGSQWTSFTTLGGTYTLQNDGTGLLTVSDAGKNIGSNAITIFLLTGTGDGQIDQSLASGGGAGMGIRKEGSGTWTLTSNSNGYSGATTISTGTLQIGNGGATGTIGVGDIELSAGAILAFNRTALLTVANDWISFTDGGIRTLRNDGTGKVTLNGGNIGLTSGTTILALTGPGDGEIIQSIASGGAVISIEKAGAGTWTLANTATNFSGTTTITAGTLEVTGLLGAGTYAQAIANDGELHGNTASAQTLSGVISGSGLLRKSAAGTLTLSGTNTYTGGTVLAAGTLALGSADALGSTGTITLSGGTLQFSASNTTDYSARFATAAGQVYAFDTNGQTVTLATPLSSSGGSLAKSGTGVLVLSAANTYDGTTTIAAGTLRIATGGSLGTGNIDIPNGTLEFTSSTVTSLPNQLFVQGTGSAPALVNNGAGLLTLQPGTDTNINVDNGETFTVGGSGDILIEKSIASAAGASLLTKTGSGTVTLTSSDNNWSGGTTISAGVLQVGDGSSDGTIGSGTITITNGRLAFNRPNPYTVAETIATFQDGTTPGIENNGAGLLTVNASNIGFSVGASGITLDLGGTGDGLMDGPIASGGAAANVAKNGTGTWTFDDVDTNYSGTTTVSAGTLEITGRLGQGSYAQAITADATLHFNSTSNQTLSGVISGSGTLVKSNAGTVTLDGANTFTGLVRVEGGSLALGSSGSLAAATSAEVNGGILDIAGTTQTIAALNGTGGAVDLGTGSLSIANAAANAYAGLIAGSGGLAKSGAGNLVLSGASSYTGTTSVAAGRLSVNGSLAATAVTVSGGELGGAGSIVGSVAVQNGGRLAPGNSIAPLAAGATTFDAGATFAYEVDSTTPGSLGSAADLLVVSGNLSIASGTLLEFTDLASSVNAFADGIRFALINYSGTWDGGLFTFGGVPLADGDSFFVGLEEWQIDYNASAGGMNFTGDYVPSSSFVTVTAVPEPGMLALLAAAAAGFAALARRTARSMALPQASPDR